MRSGSPKTTCINLRWAFSNRQIAVAVGLLGTAIEKSKENINHKKNAKAGKNINVRKILKEVKTHFFFISTLDHSV